MEVCFEREEMRTKKETDAWFRALEAERHDTSWKSPQPVKYQSEIVFVEKRVNHKARDRAMFNAGRFAEGARDADAIRGNSEVAKYLKGVK